MGGSGVGEKVEECGAGSDSLIFIVLRYFNYINQELFCDKVLTLRSGDGIIVVGI